MSIKADLSFGFVLILSIVGSIAVDADRSDRTLSASEKLTRDGDRWRRRRDAVAVEWRSAEEFVVADGAKADRLLLQRLARKKRDAAADQSPQIQTSIVHLNDSHQLMYINWAGAGSQVIVALARDLNPTSFSTSRLFISYDYGKTFDEKSVNYTTSTRAILHYFHNSPVYNSHYVFVDIVHRAIWTSTDYGVTMQQHNLQFAPRLIDLHPTNYLYMIGQDSSDYTERLWISTNFGSTWRVLHSGVDTYYWGVPPYDNETTVYIRASSGSSWFSSTPSKILRYSSFSSSATPEELFTDSSGLLVVNEFMFATKVANALNNYTLELWVSHNRESFRKAQFPSRHIFLEFFVADADEGQVFVCACINATSTNLYISESRGVRFSLSLENIMYYSPNNAFRWLSGGSVPFADLRRVEGLNGIYIATKVVNATRYSYTLNQVTMMSFNKGGDWHNIPAPERNVTGSYTCGRTSLGSAPQPNCYLNLVEKFLAQTSYSRFASVFTSPSAIGLVIANGNIGSRISTTGFNVYLSNDGGLRFNEVLSGTHYYTMGDHGGLIVAIRMYEITGDLLYSSDEGETWNEYTFIDRPKIRVYGLITEPGEQTPVFSIFGSLGNTTSHSWIVIQVNLTSVLGRRCNDSDYKQWSPTDDPNIDCLLGRKTTYERRRANSRCFNGRDYDREIYMENCPCKIEDYDCDFGYKKNLTEMNICDFDPESGVNPSGVPIICADGTYYNRTKGYRRIVGDTCEGGLADQYDPVRTICPVEANQEFLLFANRSTVHRYVFSRQLDEVLPLDSLLENTISLDYDYANDCVFWADSRQHNIKMRCLRGNDVTTKTIITENADSIEGLAYNWMSEQLFWVDSGNKRIEVARRDGSHRRVLINSTLDRPRAIALYPKFGFLFWSDWSMTNPSITRAAMDGTNQVLIVQGSRNLHWPNGLAIDEPTRRLFITDAYLDQIMTCDFNGGGFTILYSNSTLLQHPYAISIFRDQLYWTDWSLRAVMTASKNGSRPIQRLISEVPGIMDLKAFSVMSQQGQSSCNVSMSRCQSLCFEKPNSALSVTTGFTCHCSDLLVELSNGSCTCASGLAMTPNGTCHVANNSTCASYQFSCRNGNCIPSRFQCDGDNDCLDRSDEVNCTYNTCQFDQFQCSNGRCIPSAYRCDHDNDCGDMSDEPSSCEHTSCAANYFQCNNGRCILSAWRCDYDNDCQDGSDELNCSYTTRSPNCTSNQFQCLNPRVCIPRVWLCDSDPDCADGSDEASCNATSPVQCNGFRCNSTSTCIPNEFRCNGLMDCMDESDEEGCSTTVMSTTRGPCLPREFQCTGVPWCIPSQGICDGISDCPDNSDEADCDCPISDHFRCTNGRCIQAALRCNRRDDCRDNSDEMDCGRGTTPRPPCSFNEFRCGDGTCILQSYVCDGDNDCSGGDDERSCNPTPCLQNESPCGDEGECVDDRLRCDGIFYCFNRDDEMHCNNLTASLSLGTITISSVTIEVNEIIPPVSQEVRFLALIRRASSREIVDEFWTGASKTSATIEFHSLSSNTNYLITVAVSVNGSQGPPTREMPVRTYASDVRAPSPPQQVLVANAVFNMEAVLNLTWIAPQSPNGVISSYKIYIYDLDQSDNRVVPVPGTSLSNIFKKTDIVYGHYFQFKVSAFNGQEGLVSDFSDKVLYKEEGCILLNCSLTPTAQQTSNLTANLSSKNFEKKIYLSWNGAETAGGIKSYQIHLQSLEIVYDQTFVYSGLAPNPNGYSVGIGGLNPGTDYDVEIRAYRSDNKSVPICPNSCSAISTPGEQLSGPVIVVDQQTGYINLKISCSLAQLQNLTQLNYITTDNVAILTVFYKEDDRIDTDRLNLLSGVSNVTIPIQLSKTSMGYDGVYQFKNLETCKQYCFVSLVTWPSRSQISDAVCSVIYAANPRVSELRAITNRTYGVFVDVQIFWRDVCYDEETSGYVITMEESVTKQSSSYYVENATRNAASVVIRHLHRGANYTITVKRDTASAQPKEVIYPTDPLPAPSVPEISSPETGQYIVSWTMPFIANDSVVCELKSHVYYLKPNASSYAFLTETSKNSVNLTGKGKLEIGNKEASISFRVCVMPCYGYCGRFSGEHSFTGYDDVMLSSPEPSVGPSTGGSNSLALAVSIPLILIIVIILAILGVLCGRHYLLRRSLQRFERSRYDSRSNSGLFSDLVDDDPPLVQNFNEDVPMIVP